MKSLVWILLGAVVSFQLIAIAQEWKLFSAAWFGHRPVAAASVTEAQRQGAEQALREFHRDLCFAAGSGAHQENGGWKSFHF